MTATPNPYVRGQDGSWIGFLDAPKNLPPPNIIKVQPWRVSMNAEKISRPFAALPLHKTNAHGPSNRDGTLHNPTQLLDMGKICVV